MNLPVRDRKRFQVTNTRHSFAFRRHDILFFDGSDSLFFAYAHMWALGGSGTNVANIMIDLDIRHINYQIQDATPKWKEVVNVGVALTRALRNTERLENFYCLTRGPTAEEQGHFEFDDLRELAPEQFPESKRDLERWLEEFAEYPTPAMWVHDEEGCRVLKKFWKNVSVE